MKQAKYGLSFIVVISLITAGITEVGAQSDPKTDQMIQGAGSSIGALMSGIVAIEHLTKCYSSKMAGNTDLMECAMGGLAGMATTMQLGISGYSFATAGSLSSEKETNSKDLFNSERPLPTDEDFNHLNPNDEPTASSVLRDDVFKNMEKIKAQIKNLKDRGIITDEIIANPEKFLTPEQLAAFNAEKEKLMGGIEDDRDSSSPALEALLSESEGSQTEGSQTAGSQTAGFQTASLTSVFDSLDLEGLLGLKEKGIQNSAPGYYGNVSLKSLRPESKLSLFERVSLKIRQEINRKPLASGHYNTQGDKSEI